MGYFRPHGQCIARRTQTRRERLTLVAAPLAWLASIAACFGQATPAEESLDAAIDGGLQFVAREVNAWTSEKHCISCHNNGDGARTLAAAVLARRLETDALAAAAAALADIEGWTAGADDSSGEVPAFVDTRLAAIQFAAALAAVHEAGAPVDEPALARAAEKLAAEQEDDGSWAVDAGALGGSPITYGDSLATATARNTLLYLDEVKYAQRIDAAEAWLASQNPYRVVDAAGVLLGLAEADDESATVAGNLARERLLAAQGAQGGWGAFADRAPEAFDTAVAVVALAGDETPEAEEAVTRGAQWLIESQIDDGSWPETTRPPGAASYAHRVSTAAWAVQALLAVEASHQPQAGARPATGQPTNGLRSRPTPFGRSVRRLRDRIRRPRTDDRDCCPPGLLGRRRPRVDIHLRPRGRRE